MGLENLRCYGLSVVLVNQTPAVLPVNNKIMPAQTIADAIATGYVWTILKRFFADHIYPQLTIAQGPTSVSIWRDALYLGNIPADSDEEFWSQVHDKIGWAIFLQELWARPHWPGEYFYDYQIIEASWLSEHHIDRQLIVDVTQDLMDIISPYPELNVALRVGSSMLENITIPVSHGVIPAHKLRVTLTQTSGFELCRLLSEKHWLGNRWLHLPPSGRVWLWQHTQSSKLSYGSRKPWISTRCDKLVNEKSPTLPAKSGFFVVVNDILQKIDNN